MILPPQASETGALQAVMDDDDLRVAEGEPAVPASIGFIDDVPAINALGSADVPEARPPVKFGLARHMVRGVTLGDELVPGQQ